MNKVNGKRKLANLSYFCKCSGRVDLASKKLPKLSKLSLETLKLSKRLDISNMFRHLKRTNPKTHNMWLHVYTKRIDTFITNRKTQTQINQPKHVPHQLQLSYSRSRGHGLSVSHPKINLYIYIYFLPLFYIYSCKIIPILWQASFKLSCTSRKSAKACRTFWTSSWNASPPFSKNSSKSSVITAADCALQQAATRYSKPLMLASFAIAITRIQMSWAKLLQRTRDIQTIYIYIFISDSFNSIPQCQYFNFTTPGSCNDIAFWEYTMKISKKSSLKSQTQIRFNQFGPKSRK